MKKLNLLFAILIGLSILSCSKDDGDPPLNENNHVGTYTLKSVVSNTELDPEVTGTFDETALLDNIDCSSLLILKEDNSFSWDYLSLSQIVNNIMYVVTYTEMECSTFNSGAGQYEITNGGISFVFDSSVSNTNATIDGDVIIVTLTEELATDEGGIIELRNVQLTLTYEK